MSRGLRPELKEFIHTAVADIVEKNKVKVVNGCPMKTGVSNCKLSGTISDSKEAQLLCEKNYTTCNIYKEWSSDKSVKERELKEKKQIKVEEKKIKEKIKKVKVKGKRGRPKKEV